MKNAVRCVIALGACSMVLTLGCASDKTMSESKGDKNVVAVNKNCPCSGKPVDPAVHESYSGKTVGFCCTDCEAKWDKMTPAEKDAKLKAATAAK